MAIKLEGGGGKALMAWPLVEEFFFCGFPKVFLKLNIEPGLRNAC